MAPFCIGKNRAPCFFTGGEDWHGPCHCFSLWLCISPSPEQGSFKGARLRNHPLPVCFSLTTSQLGKGVSKGISVTLLRDAAPGKGFSLLPSPVAVPGSAMSWPTAHYLPCPQYAGTSDCLKLGRGKQPPSLVADESAMQGVFVGEGDAGTPSTGSLGCHCTCFVAGLW